MKNPVARLLDRHLSSAQFTYGQILGMLAPLILDQLFIYMIGLLTTSMISASGQDSVTAVSLVTPIITLMMAVLIAISSGGAIIVAQYKGHGDQEKLQEAIGQTIWIVVLLAVIANGALCIFARPVVGMLFGAAEPSVQSKASLYLAGMSVNAIVHALRVATTAGLRGVGDNKRNLIASILINVSYFVFSYLFLNVLKLDIIGTLLAFFLARFLGLISSIYYLFIQKKSMVRIRLKQMLIPQKEYLKAICKLGLPFSAEEIFFNGGTVLVSSYMVLLGTTSVAANAIANSVFNTLYAPTMAVGLLATTVIGQCIGAGRRDLAKWYGKKLIGLGYAVALLSVMIMLPMMPWILGLYQPAADTLKLTWQLLLIGIGGMLTLWPVSNIMPNTLRAAGDAYYSTGVSLIAMWLIRVGAGYVMAIPMGMGIQSIWICMIGEWLIRSALYLLRFRGSKWLAKANVIEKE